MERETLEGNEQLCKWRESDEVLKHSADVGAVIGVVIRSRHDIITSTSQRVFTTQLLQHITQQTLHTHTHIYGHGTLPLYTGDQCSQVTSHRVTSHRRPVLTGDFTPCHFTQVTSAHR